MLFRLILLLTVIPLVELALLLWINEQTSLAFTIGLVIVTGIVGAALARWQGVRTVMRIQQQMAAGQMPADAMLDGVLILLAAAVLVTPGILTDAVGFLLLLPPCRQWIKRIVRRRLETRMKASAQGATAYHFQWSAGGGASSKDWDDDVIDARIVEPGEREKPADE